MVDSVNNSTGVLGALRGLQSASRELSLTDTRVSSGLRIQSAKDGPAAYASAAAMNSDIGSLHAVSLSLSRAQSISDTGIAAGEQVSKLLTSLRDRAAASINNDLSPTQRQTANTEFQDLKSQIATFIAGASFDNANLIDGSATQGVGFIADADGKESLSLTGRNFQVGGGTVALTATDNLLTPEAAQAAYDNLTTSIENVGNELSNMSGEAKKIDAQVGFVGKLADALASGVGSLVDTNIAGDSAMIQALQLKQSLSTQSIGIVNSAPQALLSLFRS